jgi:hypothetical protein
MFTTSSNAAGTKVDASKYTIHCDTVVGTVGFAPPLKTSGPASPDLIKLKASLNGCTATPNAGGMAVSIASGSVTGKLTGSSQSCTGLLGTTTVSGTIAITWKTNVGTPSLEDNKSTVTPGAITGGLFTPGAPFTGSYGSFHIGGSGVAVSDSFQGTDGGASSVTDATTGEDAGALLNICGTPGGLKTLHLGIGDITLQ